MAIKLNCGCVKLTLPNGCVVDILTPVLDEISKRLQLKRDVPESGGYIVGYEHKDTGNIVLEKISVPSKLDRQTRYHFDMIDPAHKRFLHNEKKHNSYYMGVWHTHPQRNPVPSATDWDDWKRTLETDKTASDYVFFLIAGIDKTRVWVGNPDNKAIEEVFECPKNNEIYLRMVR